MRVLLIEDSPSVRAYVEGVLHGAQDIELLPSAPDGAIGLELAMSEKPDVILMDLKLPALDGIEVIREIMSRAPRPIVVLSGHLSQPGRDRTFEAFEAGAVEVLSKPRGLGAAEVASFKDRLLRTVRVMAEARVMRRRAFRPASAQSARALGDLLTAPGRRDIVVIGGSTGGPEVLEELFQQIQRPFHLPIVIGQHIIPGFEHGLAAWLSRTGHRVVVVREGDRIEPGVVYIAPADKHLAVRTARLDLFPGEEGTMRPSVDLLFQTTAESFGARSVAVLLSGMGEDGSRGLLSLRKAGGLTLTQAGDSCVIDGMPRAARALSASSAELAPPQLAEVLRRLRR